MFISKRKHKREMEKKDQEIEKLKEVNEKNRAYYKEKSKKFDEEIEIEYKWRFPQKPRWIRVSKYVADKFLKNQTDRSGEYMGLTVIVDKTLTERRVLFEALWEEPPVICKHCGSKSEYEYSYPVDNPMFCNERCFKRYIDKKSK